LNKMLADIKAVQGVSGVLILDLQNSISYKLLPAGLEKDQVRRLAKTLLELCRETEDPVRMDLKFDNGAAVLVKLNRAGVFVYGRPSLNLSMLELVLRSSISTVEKRVQRRSRETREIPKGVTPPASARTFVEPLVEAMNQIASAYGKHIGTYLLAQKMREAREKLLQEFPFLTNFFVNNSGMVLAIKDKEALQEESVVLAFARWVSLLRQLCRIISPETRKIKTSDLIQDSAGKLEKMGFYQLCED